MNERICYHGKLIKHIASQRMYWFCPSCHQEMPSIDSLILNSQTNNFKNFNKARLRRKLLT